MYNATPPPLLLSLLSFLNKEYPSIFISLSRMLVFNHVSVIPIISAFSLFTSSSNSLILFTKLLALKYKHLYLALFALLLVCFICWFIYFVLLPISTFRMPARFNSLFSCCLLFKTLVSTLITLSSLIPLEDKGV